MTIILRNTKGSQLTFEEMDGNFENLDVRLRNIEISNAQDVDYNDLINKPELFSGSYDDLTGKPALFSGSYNDLSGKPTIPTDINQLTDVDNLLTGGGIINETDPIFSASEAANITSVDTNNWDTAYSWGDHAQAGYLTSSTEADPIFSSSPASTITNTKISNWDTAYSWGDHSTQNYLQDSDFAVAGIMTSDGAGNYIVIEDESANWDTAFSWGDHALAGYLDSTSNISDLANVSTTSPSAGQVLKWNGSQWAPASDSVGDIGAGITLADLSVSTAVAGSASLVYDNTTGTFTYTPPDLSSFITSVAFADLTAKPTTLSGYGITDGVAQGDNISTLTNDSGYLTSETTTSLSFATNTLTYTDETGAVTNIDLSLYLDDTNLARLTSGTVDGETGIATFTRDDATTFTVDFSALFDDTNLARITSLGFDTGTGDFTFTRNDATSISTNLDGRYLTSYTETDPVVGAITGLVKSDGAGNISAAVAGTDYSTFDGAFGSLSGTPTTLSGYGITDAATSAQGALADSAVQPADLGDFTFTGTTLDTAASAAITVTPDVTFSGSVSFTTLSSTGVGTLTLDSASSINLEAADDVSVVGAPFRLAQFTNTQRNALSASNGDMIYNTDTNNVELYSNGAWYSLDMTLVP